ncbi:MAG: DNA-binding response regulator [Betaproteobacteria bacterium]|nr:MAG: DNA-binding response regulator [Betaproteobacteria bacterium]
MNPKALIADDERLMREQLRGRLSVAWPELQLVAEARNGSEALALFDRERPDLAFLDIRMPAPNGLEVAAKLAGQCHLVFVTAYEAHAIEAFERGAVDYLLKPVDPDRLAVTVERLKQRLKSPPDLDRLASILSSIQKKTTPAASRLRWIQATVGNQLRIVAIDEVLFFQATDKYTRVVMQGGEALIRKPLKELLGELDAEQYWQIHRATIVNMRAVANVARDVQGRLIVSIKDCPERLEVSRGYTHLFKSL